MSLFILALAQFALAGTGPGGHQFKDKEVVTVDPSMAYVVIRSSYPSGIELFHKVEDADRKAWEHTRQEAYNKAAKKYDRALKTYETDIKAWDSGNVYDRQLLRSKPKKPEAVTLESIPMSPVELDNFVTIGRKPAVAEDSSGMRTFIVQVIPGTYHLSGAPGMFGAIGSGTCFCMGSVGFTVRPGQIVDAGTVTPASKDFFAPATYTLPAVNPPALPQLAGRTIEPAKIVAIGKTANFKATPVTRLNAVANVLGYDRDVPLDAANGNRPIPAVR